MGALEIVPNFIDGDWQKSSADADVPVTNPATGEAIARVSLGPAADVAAAAAAAAAAFPGWRRTPAGERVQYLFKFKELLEQNFSELARSITLECGKTLQESGGELRRGIENVEGACAIPVLSQGYNSEDIATGIDETLVRQPVGVVAAVTPFNFPAMIPLWFTPWALACGNCIILKPSEQVPLTVCRLLELLRQTGLPPGVVQAVNGSRETVEAIVDHPLIQAVSFVGSTAAARAVYSRASARGKRVQCQGGARNPIVVLPDADLDGASRIIAESAFGCAGQRCLAGSLVVAVDRIHEPLSEALSEIARSRRLGSGLDSGVEMGPVISRQSRERIRALIEQGLQEGASLAADGRGCRVVDHENGFFVGPTVLDRVDPGASLLSTEIFGPVVTLVPVAGIEEAIRLVNRSEYGNMACLFTESGRAARRFRYEAEAGNIGINVGVAAPVASFPFSGWKSSFFGDLHGQGRDAVDFYTRKKVVIERWD